MNILPNDILSYIYSFDNTYKVKYRDCVDSILERNNNIQAIKVFKLLVSYNNYYCKIYRRRIPSIKIEINDIIYQAQYNIKKIVVSEILNNKDYSCNKLREIWREIYNISQRCWIECYILYKKDSNNQDYYYQTERNHMVSNSIL